MKKLKHILSALIVVVVFAIGWTIGGQQLAQMQEVKTAPEASSTVAPSDTDVLPCTVRVWYSAWDTPPDLRPVVAEVLEDSGREVVESESMADGKDITVYWINSVESGVSHSIRPTSLTIGAIPDAGQLQDLLADRLGGCEKPAAE